MMLFKMCDAPLRAGWKLCRWEAWLARLRDDLEEGRMYDAEEWRLDALSLTLNWAHSRKELPQEPQEDAAEVSQRLYSKYIGGRSQDPPCDAS